MKSDKSNNPSTPSNPACHPGCDCACCTAACPYCTVTEMAKVLADLGVSIDVAAHVAGDFVASRCV